MTQKKVFIPLIIFVVLLLIIGFYFFYLKNLPNMNSDNKKQEDLATIARSIGNYINNNANSTPPNNLTELNIKGLNNSITDYTYLPLVNDGSSVASYQLCTTFKTNTFSPGAYYNVDINDAGRSASDFSVHTNGKQCYVDNIEPDTEPYGNMDLVLTSTEKLH